MKKIFKSKLTLCFILLFIVRFAVAEEIITVSFNGYSKPIVTPSIQGSVSFNETDRSVNLIGSTGRIFMVYGVTSDWRLWITSGSDVEIVLNDVSITGHASGSSYLSPIELNNGAHLLLTLSGKNQLTSKNTTDVKGAPAIKVIDSSQLTIRGEGSLTCTGGGISAGIGGTVSGDGTPLNCGDIIIESGTITAKGGNSSLGCGAGIGGGGGLSYESDGGDITIHGGKVTAIGGSVGSGALFAPGIGAGIAPSASATIPGYSRVGGGGTLTMTGGTLEADAGSASSKYGDIGGYTNTEIHISGGSLFLKNEKYNKATFKDSSSTLVYRVKVDGSDCPKDTDIECSYNGGAKFKAQTIDGYFYFWLPTTAPNPYTLIFSRAGLDDILKYGGSVIANHNDNTAPIKVVSSSSGKEYDTLKKAFDAESSGSTLTLKQSISLAEAITTSKTLTLNLNGKKITEYSGGKRWVTQSGGTLTLTGGSNSGFLSPVKMTNNGLVKLDHANYSYISLGDVSIGNVSAYLAKVTKSESYAAFSDNELYIEKKRLDKQYYGDGDKIIYGWLPAGTRTVNITADGSYFAPDAELSLNKKMTVTLKDMTNEYQLSQGDVTINTNNVSYRQNRTSYTKETLYLSESSSASPTNGKVTVKRDCSIQFKSPAKCNQLSVESGTLKLLGTVMCDKISVQTSAKLDVSEATAITVTSQDGFPLGSNITVGSGRTPKVTLNGTQVWMGTILKESHSTLTNPRQGSLDLTTNNRYFSDNTKHYFWLDNTTDLSFDSSDRFYYATVPSTWTHNSTLTTATYKTRIQVNGVPVYYKNIKTTFDAVATGQEISLVDNYNATEEVSLGTGNLSVTFNLNAKNLSGTVSFNANGGHLKLTGPGTLSGTITLSGLVYSDIVASSLTGSIIKNGQSVIRYMADKVLANEKVTYSWSGGSGSDEAMVVDDKACLWLPKGTALGHVDLGYSTNMAADKCGEILTVATTTHSSNVTTVNPFLNIARAKVEISGNSSVFSLAYNGINRTGFTSAQPITIYGTGTNPIEVRGTADVQHMTLKDLSIPLTASHDFPAIKVEGNSTKLVLYLSGKNNVKGGSKSTGVSAGINVAENATLAIYNDDSSDEQQNGTGQLIVKGGANIANVAPGIGGNYGEATGNIEIHGGTIRAEGGLPSFHGIGNGGNVSSSNTPVKIYSGSVDASREWKGDTPHSFVNGKASSIYLMTVNTGLTPNKKYLCTYYECDPEPFPVITDSEGKCYFWIPERTQTQKPEATFRDPATNNTTTIQLVKVDKNDKNVAPIVAELVQPGKEIEYHNNLKDAFDAVSVSGATIRLLIDIDNLATIQTVKTGYQVTLDLDRFNLDTKNSKEAGFIAETGGYLYITGEGEGGTGNIKSTFKISGDIYIAGIVPLTDATPLLGDKAVFRTLINGLPDSPNNIYTYSYGSVSNRTFYLHDGVACLWLPDTSGELTFRVTQGNNVTDYTAGTITTNTQRTESMGCQAVGVIARVVKGETVRDFNNLPDAFSAAAETAGNEVRLLANVALTKSVTIRGNNDFTLNLNGMGLTGATGTILTVGANRYLTITDNSTGTKGNVQMDMLLSGRLFVSGNVNLKGNVVSSSGSADVYLWRTMVDVSNLVAIPSEVGIQGGNTSKVLGLEGCYWLPKGVNQNLTFTAGGNTYPITGVNINDNHQDNLITLGIGNEEARITGKQKYDTFAKAWAAAVDGDEIVLLKDATIAAKLTLDNDRNIRVDVARYTLGARDGATIEVGAGTVLRINSSNGNGRMLVPVQNKGVLFIGSGIQSDRLTDKVTDTTGNNVWRALVSNLPDGMPDDGIYTFSFGQADPQTGSFYVSSQTACLWLKERKAERLTFPQFNSYTDNVTIEKTHANQVIWGQSNVAQVQNTMYTKLGEAFAKNTNQTVTLLKSAVLETTQEISSRMKLEMGGL